MDEFPKIETLYDRKEDFSVDTTKIRVPEFQNVKWWIVSEKIDGTNVRIGLHSDGTVEFGGRTDNAQMPTFLSEYLRKTFTPEKLQGTFERNADGTFPETILFAEGYGAKIQKGGGLYRPDCAVVLFDVRVGNYWLSMENVSDVADKLGINNIPNLRTIDWFPDSEDKLRDLLEGGNSILAKRDSGQIREAEGIVARAFPMLYLNRGQRCIYKLKFSDFRKGKR